MGFQVLPRRGGVERFLAWINRNRRLWKGFRGIDRLGERLPLCRLRHAIDPPARSFGLRFESAGSSPIRLFWTPDFRSQSQTSSSIR